MENDTSSDRAFELSELEALIANHTDRADELEAEGLDTQEVRDLIDQATYDLGEGRFDDARVSLDEAHDVLFSSEQEVTDVTPGSVTIEDAHNYGQRIIVPGSEILAGDILEIGDVAVLDGKTIRAKVLRIDKWGGTSEVGLDVDFDIEQGELRGVWSHGQYVVFRPFATRVS